MAYEYMNYIGQNPGSLEKKNSWWQNLIGKGAQAGFTGSPLGMGLTIGGGLLQGLLSGNQANNRFGQAMDFLSPQSMDKEFANVMRTLMPGINARSNAMNLAGQRQQHGIKARIARGGLGNTGIGGDMASGVAAGAGFKGAQLRGDMEIAAMREAYQRNTARSRTIMGMLATPYGAVSPMSSMLSGAGRGMEAAQMAKWAEILAGRGEVA
jgi:hypothetical protein